MLNQQFQLQQNFSTLSATQYSNQILQQVLIEKSKKENNENINEFQNIPKCNIHPTKPSKMCKTCKKNQILIEKLKTNQNSQSQEQEDEKNIDQFQLNFSPDQNDNQIFPINGNQTTFNINQLLHSNIINLSYFKELFLINNYDLIIQQICQKATHVEPWKSGQYGIPSIAFCCLYKLMLLRLNIGQIKNLLSFQTNQLVRCIGFLYLRYVCHPNFLLQWFSKYLQDFTEVRPTNDPKVVMTISKFIENILSSQDYYQTRLPLIPLKISRQITAYILMLQELNERFKNNISKIHKFKRNTNIFVMKYDQENGKSNWFPAKILELEQKNYINVIIYNSSEQNQEGKFDYYVVYLGNVKLMTHEDEKDFHKEIQLLENQTQQIQYQKSKSRSKSRDSSNQLEKKKKQKLQAPSQDDYLKEVIKQQQNMASAQSKSEVAKKPTSYKSALSISLPKGSKRTLSRSPSPIKQKEEIIVQHLNDEEIELQKEKQPQFSKEFLEKQKKLFETYCLLQQNE